MHHQHSHKYRTAPDADVLYALAQDASNEAAFAELYARYSQRTLSYCVRVLGSEDDGRDVLQEAIALLRKELTEWPLSFNNFRE